MVCTRQQPRVEEVVEVGERDANHWKAADRGRVPRGVRWQRGRVEAARVE